MENNDVTIASEDTHNYTVLSQHGTKEGKKEETTFEGEIVRSNCI